MKTNYFVYVFSILLFIAFICLSIINGFLFYKIILLVIGISDIYLGYKIFTTQYLKSKQTGTVQSIVNGLIQGFLFGGLIIIYITVNYSMHEQHFVSLASNVFSSIFFTFSPFIWIIVTLLGGLLGLIIYGFKNAY